MSVNAGGGLWRSSTDKELLLKHARSVVKHRHDTNWWMNHHLRALKWQSKTSVRLASLYCSSMFNRVFPHFAGLLRSGNHVFPHPHLDDSRRRLCTLLKCSSCCSGESASLLLCYCYCLFIPIIIALGLQALPQTWTLIQFPPNNV